MCKGCILKAENNLNISLKIKAFKKGFGEGFKNVHNPFKNSLKKEKFILKKYLCLLEIFFYVNRFCP